ncbi:MAG: hypothetical protein SFY95_08835 [Planctomycetota bacterium]|nr:hypothetical protein [Planctomycetota bacterium]
MITSIMMLGGQGQELMTWCKGNGASCAGRVFAACGSRKVRPVPMASQA